MTNQGIFIFAMIVFTLMVIGLGLTILEFRTSMAELQAGAAEAETRGRGAGDH